MIRLDVGGHPWAGSAGFDVTKRVIVLGILVLVMLIPLMMIGDMVAERAGRRYQVEGEIAGLWGGSQAIAGPVLAVPYVTRTESTLSGGTVMQSEVRHLVYFLPEILDIRADLQSELRYRSIYEALVYATDVTMIGRFAAPDFSAWRVPPGDILWSEATLFVGLTDLRGIRSISFSLDDRPIAFAPGLAKTQLFRAGLQARLANASVGLAGRSHSFTLKLAMNGSGALEFLPLGNETTLAMSADWPHPSFTGAALPLEREIRNDGFTAAWAMSYLARAYPPSWRADDLAFGDLPDGRIGVALVLPGDSYQQTDRIVKYGVLVIGLTFATIFVIGLLRTARAHLAQYLLVGSSICIFYLLVLSLSEHLRFVAAYAIASVADIATVALYVWRTVSRFAGYVVAAILGLVHGWMYLLLQMEDYVLVAGSLGLFAALVTVMYVTRNIDWYRVGQPAGADGETARS
jgi:inner membrane protein